MTAKAARRVTMIWAQAQGGVIGAAGGIPWHVPEDGRHFRELTVGGAVIMGRTTWDSLPDRFRPLPGRRNIVLTRDAAWSASGADAAGSIAAALTLAGEADAWIIGGAQVYADAMAQADRLEVTELDLGVEGDAYAPPIDDEWIVASTEPISGWATSTTGVRYRFVRYERVAGSAH
jgi:dihydrofolate reductase